MSIAVVNSFGDGVGLCINLLGAMCFWSGIMNVLNESGAVKYISKLFSPLITLIFGKGDMSEKTKGSLTSYLTANFLGLGNATLPLGIDALKNLSPDGKKSGERIELFLVLSTVPFQFLPTTLIVLRSKYGSLNPYDVVPYIWLCSGIIIAFAVILYNLLFKVRRR